MNRMGLEVANNALEMIIVFDEIGNILFTNSTANQELGYAEGLDNVNLRMIMRHQFQQQEEFSVEVIQNMKEAVLYRKNESCFPSVIKITSSDIVPGQFQLMALNNTRKAELEKRLVTVKQEAEEALKVRNQFVANVTHELRTPLNGISGHVRTLQDTELTTEQRRTTDIVLQCCDNMAVIINNILDFEKLEEGNLTIEEKEFKFREMLNQVIDMQVSLINEKGLHLIVDVAEDIPDRLLGDGIRLQQVLGELLSNAVKFTSLGYVSLEVTKTLEFEDEIELFFMVRDTGIGISREEQDKIFQSFSQGDGSITRKYGGTGLGLSISKQLVELMGGSINMESEKGKGSTFSFNAHLRKATSEEPEEEVESRGSFVVFQPFDADVSRYEDIKRCFTFGTPENIQEIKKKMEKLVICLELGAWDRAEAFSGDLKVLMKNQERLKKAVFRLEMCIRKENYDKSMQRYQDLKEMLEAEMGGA